MPGKHLTISEIDARAEALEECAEHMVQNWTDDDREREAGNALARRLLREAAGWRDRAAKERGKLRRLAHGLDAAMAHADA